MELIESRSSLSEDDSSVSKIDLDNHDIGQVSFSAAQQLPQFLLPVASSYKLANKENYGNFKFKKVKLEEKKYFNKLQRLAAATKKKNTLQGTDGLDPDLYRSESDEDLSDESDLDHFEFQESVRVKLGQLKVSIFRGKEDL